MPQPDGVNKEKAKRPTDYQSVQKALQILLAFVPHNQAMGTMEVSQKLGLHKSTVSRLLGVLTHYDFLQQDSKTKKFMMGRSAARIGTAIRISLQEHLVAIAQPYIDELRNRVGETVALEVWTGADTILAYRAEVFHLRREFLLRPGDRVEVHVSAGGLVILAFLPKQIVDSVLEKCDFETFTERTFASAEELKKQFGNIRKEGIFHSSGARHDDSEIFAVPIFNHEKKPVAAITLFASTERLEGVLNSDTLQCLKQTAADISDRLLYSEDDSPEF